MVKEYAKSEKKLNHYKSKLPKLKKAIEKKRINNKDIKPKEYKKIIRNEKKLRDSYNLFNHFKRKLILTTNTMNLLKINLSNEITKLFVYSEIIPTFLMAKKYQWLGDLENVFAEEENQDFNKEYFGDVLIEENLEVLEGEHHNSVLLWVDKNIPLSEADKKKTYKKVNLGHHKLIERTDRYIKEQFKFMAIQKESSKAGISNLCAFFVKILQKNLNPGEYKQILQGKRCEQQRIPENSQILNIFGEGFEINDFDTQHDKSFNYEQNHRIQIIPEKLGKIHYLKFQHYFLYYNSLHIFQIMNLFCLSKRNE